MNSQSDGREKSTTVLTDARSGTVKAESHLSPLAMLLKEVEAIHCANKPYWAEKHHSRSATADYQRRQERLEQIRQEMVKMTRQPTEMTIRLASDL
jgi:hypothetical protein